MNAISSISAKHVYILPNNSNIVLAAQQAKDLLEGEREITVIPSKSIPQGIAAAFAFQEEDAVETNSENMLEAISHVKSGQVTNAVRDTSFDELEIKSGQFIGISNSKLLLLQMIFWLQVRRCYPICWRMATKSLRSLLVQKQNPRLLIL